MPHLRSVLPYARPRRLLAALNKRRPTPSSARPSSAIDQRAGAPSPVFGSRAGAAVGDGGGAGVDVAVGSTVGVATTAGVSVGVAVGVADSSLSCERGFGVAVAGGAVGGIGVGGAAVSVGRGGGVWFCARLTAACGPRSIDESRAIIPHRISAIARWDRMEYLSTKLRIENAELRMAGGLFSSINVRRCV
jgi:hypothetical protein